MHYLTTRSHAELKQSIQRIRIETNGLAKILLERRRRRVYRELKYHLAALRFEAALIRYAYVCHKAGFKPDQSRVPAGTREGGQWTTEGGGGVNSSVTVASPVMSDAMPNPVVPGTQYAQTRINIDASALTGISTIDDTTKRLTNTLARIKDTVDVASDLSPAQYGTSIHTAFAAAVKAEGLPGVSPADVEITFGGDNYGAKGSVRTDVVLRNDVGDVIAIYDDR